ncbi:EamA family transporter [Arthrobacter sp. zg-Y1219]|uniref:DMT family transporter n=1 Tax=Arthrobacter sp. zg-Y1219 TaxID=3049067 RepID=UPI0024C2D737|nr:EamA family transporter [Arthrobacter sp. zg-Y1219]MDK1358794.1 EamA family transporter [Arthrobacter sp. zg-Y1219]
MNEPRGHQPSPVRSAMLGALFVLAASVLWGTTGTAATFAPDVGPLAIGAAAMGIGGVLQAVTAVPLLRAARLSLHAHRWTVLLGGGAVAVYPLAFYSSMHLAGVTVGTVVSIGSAPLASAVLERIVDGRRMTLRWVAGAGVAIAGTVLLCLAEATAAAGDDGERQPDAVVAGVLLGLVAGATYALYSWTAHRLMNRGIPSRAAMGATFGTGGLLLMPVLTLTGAPLLASGTTAAVGLYLALVPMFAGYLFFGWGLARVLPSTATAISLAEPVVAAVLAVVIVGERLIPAGWTGAALVLAGLLVLILPMRRRLPASGANHSEASRQHR